MVRDYTAKLRVQQFQDEAERLGVERPGPIGPHDTGSAEDYTSHLARVKRKDHDTGGLDEDDPDAVWLAANSGRQMTPETWG